MDPQTQASFIPKKPLTGRTGTRTTNIGIFWLLSVILFLGSIIAAGAAFGFEHYLTSDIANKSDSLAKAQASYDPSSISELIRLDSRINAAKTLLANHIGNSGIFTLLQNLTLQTVRFNSFGLTEGTGGSADMTLQGEALDFSSVALQSDSFGSSRLLKDVIFSDVTIDGSTGHISFRVTAEVDPSVLLYKNYISGTQTVSTSTLPSSLGTTTTTQ